MNPFLARLVPQRSRALDGVPLPQRLRWFRGARSGAPMGTMLMGAATIFLLALTQERGLSRVILATLFTVALVVGALCPWWRRRTLAAIDRARALNWRCCERCLYDLRAADDEGVCPECGTRFSADGLALRWTAADRSERPHRVSG